MILSAIVARRIYWDLYDCSFKFESGTGCFVSHMTAGVVGVAGVYFYSGFSDELKEKLKSREVGVMYDAVESVSELLESYGYILMASKMSHGFSEVTWRDGINTTRCEFEEGSELELLERDLKRGGCSNDFCMCLIE